MDNLIQCTDDEKCAVIMDGKEALFELSMQVNKIKPIIAVLKAQEQTVCNGAANILDETHKQLTELLKKVEAAMDVPIHDNIYGCHKAYQHQFKAIRLLGQPTDWLVICQNAKKKRAAD
jgi:hypothetical protein